MREHVQKSFKAILTLLYGFQELHLDRLVSLSKSDVSLFRFFWGFMTFHEVERCLCRHFAHVPGTQLKKSLDIF